MEGCHEMSVHTMLKPKFQSLPRRIEFTNLIQELREYNSGTHRTYLLMEECPAHLVTTAPKAHPL